jgi:hypothetical protein
MSDNGNFGFAKLVPGFDFLQNLAKGAAQSIPQVPGLSNWVAPTLNVEELEKRITELKAVHYWLEQNGKALGATIQALEVQKMTLATLQGMNVKMGEVADALKLKPEPSGDRKDKADKARPAGAAAVDPLQWWGALTQQFQEIASNAMKDATQKTAVDAARNMASGVAKEAMKAATGMAKAATTPAKKTPARKSAARKAAAAPRKTRSRS